MNKILIDQFSLLIEQIKLDIDFSPKKEQMKHMYRLLAVQKVLKIIENFPEEITSSKQVYGIKNLGKKSIARVEEILRTGKLSEIKISEDSMKHLKIIEELEDVFGIGRKKAYELFKIHNIVSIQDLQKKYFDGKIELPENIVKGLKYVNKIKEKIPRVFLEELSKILENTTFKISYNLFGVTCGSYRREKPTSNDIDFIITHTELISKTVSEKSTNNYLYQFVTSLKEQNVIIESLTDDNVLTKYMGICKLSNGDLCRIDIRFMPYESFYSAILYFTGSKDLNKKMRQVALDLGYVLNEYGLYDENKKMFRVSSEKEIFEFLGMEYLKPYQR